MLTVERLDVAYGGSQVLWGVDLKVGAGEVVCLMGRNGVGKTTLLKTIMGLLPPRGGRVTFEGADITGWSSDRRARAGLGYVPQGREVFPHLTVQENLTVAALGCGRAGKWDDVLELFPALAKLLGRKGGVLSGGEQQMLAIGRALMANPRLLLLDEPSMGLAPVLVEQIFETVQDINREGTTILLVEQNAAMALDVARRAYVLETGTVVLSGAAADLAQDPDVRRAYLGEM
jgi:branched-chain amino acid transport system ATP-binding protein